MKLEFSVDNGSSSRQVMTTGERGEGRQKTGSSVPALAFVRNCCRPQELETNNIKQVNALLYSQRPKRLLIL